LRADFWFSCVRFKRSTLTQVGYMGEQFQHFGFAQHGVGRSDLDLDYAIRVLKAGLRLRQYANPVGSD
jgi:hypothetical protein